MTDRTQDLQQDDFFRFKKIIVVCRKLDPSKLVMRSGEHRGTRTVHHEGQCIISQIWDFA